MSVVSVRPRDFILALFIRDDGERFLLGDNGYDFKDSQLHFSGNSIENDEVQKQGADGVMIAGQVRRASVQSFDGFVGDATDLKETIEEMRRDFIAFFAKGHHFRVIYVDTSRNSWQRKGGYLVDAPEVKELYQMHPEYHVGLNFEDVNYYSYDEDADGNEILANLVDIPVSTEASGGLVWDEDGAVSDDATVTYDTATAVATPAKNVNITDAAVAPLASFRLDGETSQNGTPTPSAPVAVNTTTGENVVKICGKNLWTLASSFQNTSSSAAWVLVDTEVSFQPGTYTFSCTSTASSNVNVINYKYSDNVDHNIFFKDVATLTFESEVEKVAISLGGNVSISNIQLELGSTATTYEPYQVQSYEVNLGKNLINFGSYQQSWDGASVEGEGTTITMSPNTSGSMGLLYDSTTYSVSIPAGRTITWSRTWAGGGTWESGTIAFPLKLTYADGTTETLSFGNTTENNYSEVISATKTLTKPVVSVKIESGGCFGITNLSAPTSFNLQLEYGTATTYAPYFTPIELCKIGDYQDYIYKSDGKWYVHKAVGKITLDGSESWFWLGSSGGVNKCYTNSYSTQIQGLPLSAVAISDHFKSAGVVTNTNNDGTLFFNLSGGASSANGNISLTGTVFSSVDSLKTWLASNITTLYYSLATPTDTEITNAALIAQLEALLTTARTFAGINNIFTITPNEQGTLEISYYTKYQPRVTAGGYIWESGGSGGATTVVNNSIGNVNPIWKVYGPTNNPTLENTTTGEQIEYVGLVADGQTLTIDMGAQTASLDGLNVISNVVGDYISLAPGANKLVYSVTGEAGASELGWSEIVG